MKILSQTLAMLVVLGVGASAYAWPPAHLVAPDGTSAVPFPRPERLGPAIAFWTQIFTRHSGDTAIIHDRENLGVIWEVVPLPTDKQGAVKKSQARALLKTKVENLKKRLARLEKSPKPTDTEDRTILTLLGGTDSPYLKGASQRIRTQQGIAGNFKAGLRRARQWLPAVKKILAEEGVPEELSALPFIESTFNPLARSSAGAAGLWQLMPATAKQYGLRVSQKVDDRLDVLKATRAAAKLLRQNYKMLNRWPLAITGYNHGAYGLRRAVKQIGSDDLMVLIDKYEKSTWGFASKNFYAEFLAALQAVRQSDLGKPPPQTVTDG